MKIKRQIILDISPNTHQNDICKFSKMINDIENVDNNKYEIIIKHQIFSYYTNAAKTNKIIDLKFFNQAYKLASNKGYKTTASVFDKLSLKHLLTYDIPFVKIANDRELDYLIEYIPRNITVYKSCRSLLEMENKEYNCRKMACISKYPATLSDYLLAFSLTKINAFGLSDHTTDHKIFKLYEWSFAEFHYVDKYDVNNPDAGSFSIDKIKLKDLLNV